MTRFRARPARAAPAAPTGTPRAAALTCLSRRDYTIREITDTLNDRGYPGLEVDAAVRSLTADGALDDRRVAAAYVRTASQVKGRGRLRIAHELEARGISRALAEEVLGRLPPEDEAEAIRKILARRRFPARPTLADRRRIFHHLLR